MIQQITNGESVTYHDVLIESGHNDAPQKVIGRVLWYNDFTMMKLSVLFFILGAIGCYLHFCPSALPEPPAPPTPAKDTERRITMHRQGYYDASVPVSRSETLLLEGWKFGPGYTSPTTGLNNVAIGAATPPQLPRGQVW